MVVSPEGEMKLFCSKDSILSQEILTAFLLEIVSICKDGARLFAEKDLTRRLISFSRPFKITPDFGGPEKSNQIKSNPLVMIIPKQHLYVTHQTTICK